VKFTYPLSVIIVILASTLATATRAQNFTFTQVPGHPLPKIVKANVPTTFELLYKDAEGVAPGEALFHAGLKPTRGMVIGHNYRQGVIVRWIINWTTTGNSSGYEADGYFTIDTNQTPNGTAFYPLTSDNRTGNYHFTVTKSSSARASLPNARVLLGKWHSPTWTFEFLSDGTVMVTDRGGSSAGGTYSILDGDRLKITVMGRFLLFDHVRVKARHTITMTDPSAGNSAETMYFQ